MLNHIYIVSIENETRSVSLSVRTIFRNALLTSYFNFYQHMMMLSLLSACRHMMTLPFVNISASTNAINFKFGRPR